MLIGVPPIALVVLGTSPDATTFDHVAWIFAAYFAIAWLLLLGVIVRPEHVTKPMLVLVTAIALATQVPLAITLESDLHGSTTGLGPSIYTAGLPEELAKAIPVLAVALIYWRRRSLTPRDCDAGHTCLCSWLLCYQPPGFGFELADDEGRGRVQRARVSCRISVSPIGV